MAIYWLHEGPDQADMTAVAYIMDTGMRIDPGCTSRGLRNTLSSESTLY